MTRQNLQKPAISEPGGGKQRACYCRVSNRQKVCKSGKSHSLGATRPPFASCAGILQARLGCKRWRAVLLGDMSAVHACDPFAGCGGLRQSGQTAPANPQPVGIDPGVLR